MEKVNSFVFKYIAYFLATGTLAFIGFLYHQGEVNASQEERLRNQEDQISLLRKENREDHRTIEARLNELLSRP